MLCKICKSDNFTKYLFKEKQFLMWDEFEYYLCNNCWVLFIKNEPVNLWNYYPSNYYSYWVKFWLLKKFFIKYPLRIIIKIPMLSFLKKKIITVSNILNSLLRLDWNYTKKHILDIWCWAWDLLHILDLLWYENLTWIDPFLKDNIYVRDWFMIHNKELFDLDNSKKYWLIMMHHSLEHTQDNEKILKKIWLLLEENWIVIIRIPIKSIFFDLYKDNWIGIDAPRHLMIHSFESFKILCNNAKFEIIDYYYDSSVSNFIVSEWYKYWMNLSDAILYWSKIFNINKYKKLIDIYNSYNKMWWSIAFYLKKGKKNI